MENVIYNNTHDVEIINKSGVFCARTTLIKITKTQSALQAKVRDLNDFSFNYTAEVDWEVFEKMKAEQCLEICYDEFHLHLVDLLKQTSSRELLLRLEIIEGNCKMVFYEKSRIKLLVFLIIELALTNQLEVINEMAGVIAQFKEANKALNTQVSGLKHQVQEKEGALSAAFSVNNHFKTRFRKDLEVIEDSFGATLYTVEKNISAQVDKLNKRHGKLMRDLESVKRENDLKGNAFVHTLRQLEQTKKDNERHLMSIEALKSEVNSLSFMKSQAERNTGDLREAIIKRDKENETLNKHVMELQKDINEAAVIIAQKTKTQDEIGKDLVQANTMLVNFNNQFDLMSKELDRLRETVSGKERTIREQCVSLQRISEDFTRYKLEYNAEDVKKLSHELFLARQRLEELEKQNREAAKINGLLTKKLTNGDFFDSRNTNWIQQPK